MLSWKTLRLVLLVCGFALFAVPAAASAASIGGHVYGGSGTTTPLQGVTVFVHNADYSVDTGTQTDANGQYTVDTYSDNGTPTALPADNYTVQFQAPSDQDWLDQYYNGQSGGTTDSSSATPVDSSASPTNIDAHLIQGGSITGTVTDPGGANLANVCVSATQVGSYGSSPEGISAADGSYTIHKLASGNYHVEFRPCDSSLNYVTEWWVQNGSPGAADQSGASSVAVSSTGSTPSSVDQQMEQGGSINGTVDDGTNGLANICVTAFEPTSGSNGFVPVGYAQTTDGTGADAIGTYTITGLRAGDYKLEFDDCGYGVYVQQWYNGKSSFDTADTVTVALDTPGTANATLVQAGSLSGKVVDGGGQPVANVCVEVYHGSIDPYGSSGGDISADAGGETQADGTYSVTGLAPGTDYHVHYSDCSGGSSTYLPGWYHDKDQSQFGTSDTVTVTAASDTALSDQTIVTGGDIKGHVTDGTNSLQNICVDATDQTSFDDYSATTDSSGNFDIQGLPTGSYVLEIYDCHSTGGYTTQYWDNATSSGAATPISVTEAATTTLPHDITMAQGGTITGHVTDGTNPLAHICVSAYSDAGGEGDATTDANGLYTISGLPFDTYSVQFYDCNTQRNWLDATYPSQVTVSSSTPVVLNTEVMQAGAHIEGHVTGNGAALGNICVDASRTDGFGYGNATTNGSGDYNIGALPAGTYTVSFSDCGQTQLWADQWYDGSATEAGATPVTLTAQQDRTGVDATMTAAGTISGTVTDGSTHNPVSSGACVYIYATNASSETDYERVVQPNADGTWTSPGLTAGNYLVGFGPCEDAGSFAYAWQFWTGATGGATTLAGAHTVAVTAAHVTSGTDAALAQDTTPPTTFISSAPSGTTSSTSADITFYASEPYVSFSCQVDSQQAQSCGSPYQITGLSTGHDHSFKVWAVDKAGNGGPTVNAVTATWTVGTSSTGTTSSSGTVGAGGTFTDTPGGTTSASDPLATSVTTPTGGSVSITDSSSITTTAPSGFTLFGHELTITAPPATTGSPLQITVTIDHSIIPSGTDTSKLTLTRDGSPAADCLGSATANPDPCVTSRSTDGSGNVTVTVLSSHASTWNLASAVASTSTGGGDGGGGGGGGTGGTGTTPTPTPAPTTTTTTTTTTTPTTTPVTTPTTTPAATKCVVPKLVGLTLAKAKKALAKAHCGVGKITKKAAKAKKGKKPKKGTVIAQKPAPGTKKPAGSKVAITLAK